MRAFKRMRFVDYDPRHSLHAVFLREVYEGRALDHVGPDIPVLECETVRRAHGRRAVGSGERDEHLDVHVFFNGRNPLSKCVGKRLPAP